MPSITHITWLLISQSHFFLLLPSNFMLEPYKLFSAYELPRYLLTLDLCTGRGLEHSSFYWDHPSSPASSLLGQILLPSHSEGLSLTVGASGETQPPALYRWSFYVPTLYFLKQRTHLCIVIVCSFVFIPPDYKFLRTKTLQPCSALSEQCLVHGIQKFLKIWWKLWSFFTWVYTSLHSGYRKSAYVSPRISINCKLRTSIWQNAWINIIRNVYTFLFGQMLISCLHLSILGKSMLLIRKSLCNTYVCLNM